MYAVCKHFESSDVLKTIETLHAPFETFTFRSVRYEPRTGEDASHDYSESAASAQLNDAQKSFRWRRGGYRASRRLSVLGHHHSSFVCDPSISRACADFEQMLEKSECSFYLLKTDNLGQRLCKSGNNSQDSWCCQSQGLRFNRLSCQFMKIRFKIAFEWKRQVSFQRIFSRIIVSIRSVFFVVSLRVFGKHFW